MSVLLCLLIKQGDHNFGKPGIPGDYSECGKLGSHRGILCNFRGKIVTNKIFFVFVILKLL